MKVIARGTAIPLALHPILHEERLCLQCLITGIQLHDCGLCYTCCTCTPCNECTRIIPFPLCECCARCPRCCQCYQCHNCNMTYSDARNICDRCRFGRSCCCSHGEGDSMSRGIRIRHAVNLNLYTDSPKRLMAAEIELCGFNNGNTANLAKMRKVMDAWHISGVGDGSLPEGGVELNTHPAAGDYWTDQIIDIMRIAHTAGVWVNNRAGCHTHIDCRDLSYLDLAKVTRIFACVEPALFSMIPVFRRDNHYCLFWAMNYLRSLHAAEAQMSADTSERKVTLLYRKELLRAIYGFHTKREVDAAKARKMNGNRYRALNLHSYLHRGTIELRMPPGTIYPENIINWGLMSAAIVDSAVSNSMVDIMKECSFIEKEIIYCDLYSKKHCSLDTAFINNSVKLLTKLAPTKVIKDWIVERKHWAAKQIGEVIFTEQST